MGNTPRLNLPPIRVESDGTIRPTRLEHVVRTLRDWARYVDSNLNGTPLGLRAYAELTANAALPTASAPVPGLSVTTTFDIGRRYIVRAKLSAQSTVAADTVRFTLGNEDGTVDLAQTTVPQANVFDGPHYLERLYPVGGISGSHTFAVSAWRFAGAGTCEIVAQDAIRIFIAVYDDGAL